MPKSWFTLGGSIVFLLTVISLFINTEQQRTGENFQLSLQSMLPAVLASTSPNIDISADGDRWAMPSYQEQIADWQAQQAGITLDETDLTAPEAIMTADGSAPVALSDVDGLVQNQPDFLTHLRQGLASLSARPDDQQALQPMLRSPLSRVSFQSSDRASIERYANRQHLSVDAPELRYLDAETMGSLLSFRRVLVEEATEAEASVICRSETDVTTGEEIETCIEVAPLGNRYSQYWIDDPNALWW